MKAGTRDRPRHKKPKRKSSVTLDQEVWDRLKAIEKKTLAKPSTVINQAVSEWLLRNRGA